MLLWILYLLQNFFSTGSEQPLVSPVICESTVSPQAHEQLILLFLVSIVWKGQQDSNKYQPYALYLRRWWSRCSPKWSHKASEGQTLLSGPQGLDVSPVWLSKSPWTKPRMGYKECILDRKHYLTWAWVPGRHGKTFLTDDFFKRRTCHQIRRLNKILFQIGFDVCPALGQLSPPSPDDFQQLQPRAVGLCPACCWHSC